jgi:hypothetical protein
MNRQAATIFSTASLAGLAYSITLANHCSAASLSCLDHYWVEHWLIGYGEGFTRRGLLGFLHQQLIGGTVNLLALNLLAIGVLGLLGWQLLHQLWRTGLNPWGLRSFLLFAALTPISGVMVETLGDPLQLCLLLTAFTLAVVEQLGRAVPLPKGRLGLITTLVVAVTVVMGLIHEGALLLFAPAFLVALARPSQPGYWRRLLKATAGLVLAIALAMACLKPLISPPRPAAAVTGMPAQALVAVHPLTRERISYSGSQTVGFNQLLAESARASTASLRQAWLFLLKPLRTGLIPLLGLLSFIACGRGVIPARLLGRIWISLALFSLPLLLIAVDWGRFAIHTLLITLLVSCLECRRQRLSPHDGAAGQPPVPLPRHWWLAPSLALAISLMAYPISDGYRINGLPLRSLYALMAFAAVSAPLLPRLRGLLSADNQNDGSSPPP